MIFHRRRFVVICLALACVVAISVRVRSHRTKDTVDSQMRWTEQETSREVRIVPAELMADVDEETTHVDFQFRIINESDTPVSIEAIDSSCSCIVTDFRSTRIPTLGSESFRVQYALGNQFGALISREVRLLTDRPSCREISCKIGGIRRRRFDVDPVQVDFGQLIAGETVSQVVKVSGEGAIFDEERIRTSDARLFITEVRNSLHGGRKVLQLRVNFESTYVTEVFEGEVHVPQIDASAPVVTIPIRAVITGPIQLVPQTAFFGSVTPGDTPTRRIRVQAIGSMLPSEITFLGIKSLSDVYRYEFDVSGKTLILSLNSALVPHGHFQDEIDVNCRFREKDYQLRLPVRAMIRRD